MVQTVSWMVQREAPAKQAKMSRVILGWFLGGGLIGGLTAGVLVLGLARIIFSIAGEQARVFAAIALLATVAYLGSSLRLWRMPKPQVRQQVPSSWRDVWPPRIASFLYAATLGLGFVTRVGSLAVFPLVVLSVGLGRWPLSIIAIFAIAGLVRSATAFVVPAFGWVGADNRVIVHALESADLVAHKLEAAVLGVAAALLVLGVAA